MAIDADHIFDALETLPEIGPWIEIVRELKVAFAGDPKAALAAIRVDEARRRKLRDERMFGDGGHDDN